MLGMFELPAKAMSTNNYIHNGNCGYNYCPASFHMGWYLVALLLLVRMDIALLGALQPGMLQHALWRLPFLGVQRLWCSGLGLLI